MLHKTQEAFLAGLFTEDNSDLLQEFSEDGPFSSSQRFQVYQNNVKFILTELLERLFPVSRVLVGEDFFRYAADRYIKNNPPQSGDITYYGDKFPVFVRDFPALKNLPYLPHIADLEWAWYVSGMAGILTPLSPEALAKTPENNIARLTFRFQPHALLLDAPYAIDKIWQCVTEKKTEQLSDIKLETPTYLMLYRTSDYNVTFLSLDESVYSFTHALYQGKNLESAIEQALAIAPDFTPEKHLGYFLCNQILATSE